MDRKEYKEYFTKYYRIPFVTLDENGNKKPVDEKKKVIMDAAIKSLGNWYDNYFDLLFRKSAIKKMNDNTMSKTIESPLQGQQTLNFQGHRQQLLLSTGILIF